MSESHTSECSSFWTTVMFIVAILLNAGWAADLYVRTHNTSLHTEYATLVSLAQERIVASRSPTTPTYSAESSFGNVRISIKDLLPIDTAPPSMAPIVPPLVVTQRMAAIEAPKTRDIVVWNGPHDRITYRVPAPQAEQVDLAQADISTSAPIARVAAAKTLTPVAWKTAAHTTTDAAWCGRRDIAQHSKEGFCRDQTSHVVPIAYIATTSTLQQELAQTNHNKWCATHQGSGEARTFCHTHQPDLTRT